MYENKLKRKKKKTVRLIKSINNRLGGDNGKGEKIIFTGGNDSNDEYGGIWERCGCNW